MRFEEWLDQERGRSAMVARHFDVTPSAVSQWRENGVPIANALAVVDLTDGAVSLEEIVAQRAGAPASQAAA